MERPSTWTTAAGANSTPSDNLWNLIYLATETLSDSFEFIGAIDLSLSIYLPIWAAGRRDWWNVGQFTLYTREAGAGRLSLAMEGPSKTDIYVEDLKEGTCDVAYTCTEPGPL